MKCPQCWKSEDDCICHWISASSSRLRFLVLQHPQEARNPKSTARLLSLTLEGTIHRVGLSWRSLSAALGETANPARWAVLYAGQLKEADALSSGQSVHLLPATKQPEGIEGVILLDGNWKQAKSLWWRNPWLLKLTRVVLTPQYPSRFGPVARQPRKYCLCTLEAAQEILDFWKEKPAARQSLEIAFGHFLKNFSSAAPRTAFPI